ncbi:MAG: TlpA family protein disulfide reductase [Deltaproteobacteria bacterium]|nr:TlpA family protein disulfide reductase [Deltaproteobacteria bacterium]
MDRLGTLTRGMALFLLMALGAAITAIPLLQAQDSSSALRKASVCESFGVQRFEARKEAPSFSLKDLNGKQISLNEYKWKPLLLFFWGSWCLACKEDIALLEKFVEKNRGQLEILTIAIDGEKEKRVRKVVKDHRISLPVLLDQKEQVARTYGVRMIPTAFLINRLGLVEGMVVGQRDWCSQEALSAVKELLDLR